MLKPFMAIPFAIPGLTKPKLLVHDLDTWSTTAKASGRSKLMLTLTAGEGIDGKLIQVNSTLTVVPTGTPSGGTGSPLASSSS